MNKGEIDAGGILRIIAFLVGLGLLISGFIDLGRLGSLEVLNVLSTGGTALLKVIFGAFLMVLGISPESVGMIIEVIIRR